MALTYRANGPAANAVFLHLPNEGALFLCTGVKQCGALLQFFSYDRLIHSLAFEDAGKGEQAFTDIAREIMSVLRGYREIAVYTGDDTRVQYP